MLSSDCGAKPGVGTVQQVLGRTAVVLTAARVAVAVVVAVVVVVALAVAVGVLPGGGVSVGCPGPGVSVGLPGLGVLVAPEAGGVGVIVGTVWKSGDWLGNAHALGMAARSKIPNTMTTVQVRVRRAAGRLDG